MTVLSPEEYRKAIYIDFEGEGWSSKTRSAPKPHMVGTFRPNATGQSGQYCAHLFQENWKPVANHLGDRGEVVEFESFFQNLCSDASQTGSRLIHWSIYEEAALKDHLTTATFKKIEPLLYNLLPPARRYANKRRSFGTDETARNKTLEEFCSALLNRGPFPPLALGAAKVCRKIDKACQAHRRWKHFSDAEKTVVKDFIAYNTGDCRASWLIAKRLGNAYKKHVR